MPTKETLTQAAAHARTATNLLRRGLLATDDARKAKTAQAKAELQTALATLEED